MIRSEDIVHPMRSFQRLLSGVVCCGLIGLVGCSAGSSRYAATNVERSEVTPAASSEVRFTAAETPRSIAELPENRREVTTASYAAPLSTPKSNLVQADSDITPETVATWAQAGARDDVIIDRIERSDTVIRLTAGDEMRLRRAGVSDDVICAMKETARR